jgi:hypothetical protein
MTAFCNLFVKFADVEILPLSFSSAARTRHRRLGKTPLLVEQLAGLSADRVQNEIDQRVFA